MAKDFLTRVGLETLKKKILELEAELRELRKGKAEAFRFGDNGYHENASYEEIMRRELLLESKIGGLGEKIREAALVKSLNKGGDKIEIGSSVRIKLGGERESVFEITDTVMTDPLAGKISAASPLGRALIGKRAGEDIEYKTEGNSFWLKILEIN